MDEVAQEVQASDEEEDAFDMEDDVDGDDDMLAKASRQQQQGSSRIRLWAHRRQEGRNCHRKGEKTGSVSVLIRTHSRLVKKVN